MNRSVSCALTAELTGDTTLELQVAVAGPAPAGEQLSVTVDGQPLVLREVAAEAGGRLHTTSSGPGLLEVTYSAVVGPRPPAPVGDLDSSTYLRPSRYAESDRLHALASSELSGTSDPAELLRDVSAWVGRRLAYVSGSSRGTDGAVDTLLAGAGVCRDFAHLAVALLRARDVPARLVAVYAPGLQPMDFHAVVEAVVDGRWCVADPTLLAPRSTLVRISTGRDAADTSFLSSYGPELILQSVEVSAVVDGDLPSDDLDELVVLG